MNRTVRAVPRPSKTPTALSLLVIGAIVRFLSRAPLRADDWYRSAVMAPVDAATFEQQQPTGVLRLGPIYVDLTAEGGVQYSDNVLLTRNAEPGWSATGSINFSATWQAAKSQQLKLTGEIVEDEILSGPGKSRSYILFKPGSAFHYAVYVGGVRLMPFVDLMRQVDPFAVPTINNTELFKQSSYDAGLQVDVPLNHYVAQLTSMRGLYTSQSDSLPSSTRDRQSSSIRLMRVLGAGTDYGIDAFYAAETEKNGPASSNATVSSALFSDVALSRNFQVTGEVGYYSATYRDSVVLGDATRDSGPFGKLTLIHRIRPHVRYSVTLSDSQTDGVTSNYYTSKAIDLSPTFDLTEHLTMKLQAGLERIKESSTTGETGILRSVGASFEYSLRRGYSINANVHLFDKSSTVYSRAFAQKTAGVTVIKQF